MSNSLISGKQYTGSKRKDGAKNRLHAFHIHISSWMDGSLRFLIKSQQKSMYVSTSSIKTLTLIELGDLERCHNLLDQIRLDYPTLINLALQYSTQLYSTLLNSKCNQTDGCGVVVVFSNYKTTLVSIRLDQTRLWQIRPSN